MRRIVNAWWPLALSWLLMSVEVPMLSAVIARLADPTINLAAYGSVAQPLIQIIIAPILTLLSLSTAMSRDWDSYLKGRRIMMLFGGVLTLIHVLIAFTPAFDFLVEELIGAPQEIVEPARISMMIGVPWTYAVAYRRFNQGILIRFDHSRTVTIGTLLRFVADVILLAIAWLIQTIPGASVATLMMVVGVITEAIYTGIAVRPVLHNEVRNAPLPENPATMREMVLFFIPLAITPFLNMFIRPIGSAALSRFPDPLPALAVWPVTTAFLWLILTSGTALNEVVIAFLDRPGARISLIRFTAFLSAAQFTVVLILAFTPLSYLWFWKVSGLNPTDARLGAQAFLLMIPLSFISPLNSWFVGNILHQRKSRAVTEGMLVYLVVFISVLLSASAFTTFSGLYIIVGASTISGLFQTAWLGLRSRPSRAAPLAEPAEE